MYFVGIIRSFWSSWTYLYMNSKRYLKAPGKENHIKILIFSHWSFPNMCFNQHGSLALSPSWQIYPLVNCNTGKERQGYLCVYMCVHFYNTKIPILILLIWHKSTQNIQIKISWIKYNFKTYIIYCKSNTKYNMIIWGTNI